MDSEVQVSVIRGGYTKQSVSAEREPASAGPFTKYCVRLLSILSGVTNSGGFASDEAICRAGSQVVAGSSD